MTYFNFYSACQPFFFFLIPFINEEKLEYLKPEQQNIFIKLIFHT